MDHSSRKLSNMETSSPPHAQARGPSDDFAGPNVRLKRHRERGSHERAAVYAIIDEALLAHVAFNVDGVAMTLPTAHARIGDQLYLHGARANRTLCSLEATRRASATFTLIDGLVLARTAFHHSMNFRSAVVIGTATEVTDLDEKKLALRALIDHMAPGRMNELGEPTSAELQQTLVIRLSIEEASVKQRAGDPLDAPGDLGLDVWAGTVPLTLTPGTPKPDPALRPDQAFSAAAATRALPRPELQEKSFGAFTLSTDPSRLQFEYIFRYLSEDSYWAQGITREQLRHAMQHSLCVGAYLGDSQVGFARVLSDGTRFSYLADVFVDSAQRGQGLGKAIVEFTLDQPSVRDSVRWVLGTRDAHTLYERDGFVSAPPDRYMLRIAQQNR
jgi:nitroimidazol reductase NimA-like FMN-containing flavoprotein (pyridoxamine 5'-phosphate oxidase superfamily)/GNAT superfamily N-acetyltransferase